jgi:NADH-quinone oxidoreductase subunit N
MDKLVSAYPALPEMLLLAGTVLILLIDLFLKGRKAFSFYLVELLLILVLISLMAEKNLTPQVLYAGHYLFDGFARLMKEAMVLLTFFIFAYTHTRREFDALQSEFKFLMLFSLLGAMVLSSALSLLTLYLGLELLSLPLYALIALHRDCAKGGEAAIKYFIMGALASGFLLFGFSLLYGLTGSIELPQIASQITPLLSTNPAYLIIMTLILTAIAFKLGIVPFHMWIADVYEGAPSSVTIYLASVPKLAVLALFVRIFVDSLAYPTTMMPHLLFCLSVLSLIFGNCAALVQKSLRRLLAYSTVANMGLIFIVFGLASPQAQSSGIFYALVYTFSTVGIFGLILLFRDDIRNIDDLKGLHAQKPYLAFLFLLTMLSLAGIPPLLGFDAKLLIITSLLHQQQYGLSIVVVIFSVVAAAYYLKIIRSIYFESNDQHKWPTYRGFNTLLININILALLGFGIFPSHLMALVYS